MSPKALAPAVWLHFHSLGLGEACGDFLLMFFGSNHTIKGDMGLLFCFSALLVGSTDPR